MGCHFLLQGIFLNQGSNPHLLFGRWILYHRATWESDESESRSVSLWPHGLHSPWNSPGQNTGVGSCSLFQGIFPTQGSNQGLPHCRRILYQLSHLGSPRIVAWVTYPFSRWSSWTSNWTQVSRIAGRFLPTEPPEKLQSIDYTTINCIFLSMRCALVNCWGSLVRGTKLILGRGKKKKSYSFLYIKHKYG